MTTTLHDFRFALRALQKRPTYAILTVVVLALAIGANATVFSVFNGLYLRALPYPDDDRLVAVYNSYPRSGMEFAGTSIPDYLERREEAASLQSLGIANFVQRTLGHEGDPEQLLLVRASPSLFEVLQVAPLLGRSFGEDEAVPGNDRVIVISHDLWRDRFGARADIVGNDIRLNGEPHTVIGVMPQAFAFPNRDVRGWVPFAWAPEEAADTQRGNEFSASFGRLAPGATAEGLTAELDAIVARNVERHPQVASARDGSGFTGKARSLRDFAVGDLREMVLILQAIVLAVLLIACANIANLQLARIAARRKELSMRMALGARRRQLANLVVAESTVLAVGGAALGLAVAYAGLELIRGLGLDRARQGFDFALDPAVIGFTVVVAVFAALVAALLPVISLWRESPARVVQASGRLGGGDAAMQGFRRGLVVAQMAIGVALLAGAGLLAQGFHELQREGAGFATDSTLTARVTIPESRYPDDAARARFLEQAIERLGTLPGVTHAAYTAVLPLSGNNWAGSFAIDGYEPPPGAPTLNANQRSISEDYLPALSIPILRGRNFERHEAERVVIIDENMARRYWPDGDSLGQRIQFYTDDADVWYTIVGVARAVKHASLTEGADRDTIYWHYLQRPMPFGMFTLRTSTPPEAIERQARAAVLAVDPDLPLWDVRTFESRLHDVLGPQRAPMVLTVVFGAVALVLAVVGIYGVLSWAVAQRHGEIGLRMALGARGADIIRMVVGQGGRLIAVGVVAGLLVALALGRVVSSHLTHVNAVDGPIFAGAAAILVLTALFASWVPARRAAGVNPVSALREE